MGFVHLRKIADELIASGRSDQTPVAAIRWGTYEGQRVAIGTLGRIADIVEAESFQAPVVVVIGEVVSLHEELQWFEQSLGSAARQVVTS